MLILFFIILTQVTLANTNSIGPIHKDLALWKIGQEIYYQSDLTEILTDLQRYQCLNQDNKLLTYLDFKTTDFKDLKEILRDVLNYIGPKFRFKEWDKIEQSPWAKTKFHRLLLLLMLSEYSKSQKVVVHSKLIGLLEKAVTLNHCIGPKNLGKNIEKFLRVEVFLRSRFNKDSFWVTPEDLAAYQGPLKDKKLIEAELKEKKATEALQVFLESLAKQIGHELF